MRLIDASDTKSVSQIGIPERAAALNLLSVIVWVLNYSFVTIHFKGEEKKVRKYERNRPVYIGHQKKPTPNKGEKAKENQKGAHMEPGRSTTLDGF